MSKINENYLVTGNIGHDATIKEFESGKKLMSFNLAINKSYKKDGEKKKSVKWVQIESWGTKDSQFKIAEYLKKGTLVSVSGEPIPRSFIDKEGNLQQEQGIIMDEIFLLSSNTKED